MKRENRPVGEHLTINSLRRVSRAVLGGKRGTVSMFLWWRGKGEGGCGNLWLGNNGRRRSEEGKGKSVESYLVSNPTSNLPFSGCGVSICDHATFERDTNCALEDEFYEWFRTIDLSLSARGHTKTKAQQINHSAQNITH